MCLCDIGIKALRRKTFDTVLYDVLHEWTRGVLSGKGRQSRQNLLHRRRLGGTQRSDLEHYSTTSPIVDYAFFLTSFLPPQMRQKLCRRLGAPNIFGLVICYNVDGMRVLFFPLNSGILNPLIPVAVIKGVRLDVFRPLTHPSVSHGSRQKPKGSTKQQLYRFPTKRVH